jgi:pyruvate formate lyase activating enzyme
MAQTQTLTLESFLRQHVREGELYERLDGEKVVCFACGHRCRILPGHRGVCRVRFNEGGKLFVPYGYVSGLQVDPIEKKPFFHALPGARALSFGMLGCDLHCAYCQNWITSQALRDERALGDASPVTPERLVELALEHGAKVVTSTYNEPLITAEWAAAVMRLARQHGLRGSFVSNGHGTREVLEYLRPFVDLFKVDLKSFRQSSYRELGGVLDRVLETIGNLVELGFWVEVVTLVVPGFNDSETELRDIARFLRGVSADIPWHVTAFHSDYRMMDRTATPASTLRRAREIGLEEGLRYVYAGNLPGMLEDAEDTRCHSCGELLVERFGFRVLTCRISKGRCPRCQTVIPGIWE